MEHQEELHNITEVVETNSKSETNAFLSEGWQLLKVLAKRDEVEYPFYVLGWPHPRPAKYPKFDL
jgi:hypothetical protein